MGWSFSKRKIPLHEINIRYKILITKNMLNLSKSELRLDSLTINLETNKRNTIQDSSREKN